MLDTSEQWGALVIICDVGRECDSRLTGSREVGFGESGSRLRDSVFGCSFSWMRFADEGWLESWRTYGRGKPSVAVISPRYN